MGYTIPTSEPETLRVGDTWEWTRALADFPASTWTLHYVLINSSSKISIQASADGDVHAVSVAAATTVAYTAARYDWEAYVTDGTDRYTVLKGAVDVLPDLSSVASYDARSHARTMLDAIEAELESRATAAQLDLIQVDFQEHGIQRQPGDLLKLRDKYAAMVAAEDSALAGKSGSGFVQMRF